MPQPSHLPILSLAARALSDAVRAVLPLLKIYWLPITIYTMAVSIMRVAWFEHITPKSNLPVWSEVALWAPFGAVIAIAAFRYFDSARLPDWRQGFAFGRAFWFSVLCLFIVNLVYRYAPYVEQQGVWAAWRYSAGPFWTTPTPDGYATIAGMRLLAQIVGFAVNALVGAIAMGAIWLIATTDKFDAGRLKTLLLMFPLSLFAYLCLFEVVYNQVGLLINWLYYWIGIPYPEPPQSADWRERLAPELLREIYNIPAGFIVTMLWLTAIATAFRFLDVSGRSDGVQSAA